MKIFINNKYELSSKFIKNSQYIQNYLDMKEIIKIEDRLNIKYNDIGSCIIVDDIYKGIIKIPDINDIESIINTTEYFIITDLDKKLKKYLAEKIIPTWDKDQLISFYERNDNNYQNYDEQFIKFWIDYL